MANVLGFVGLGCCAAGFVFAILALALPYWNESEVLNSGLWSFCFTSGGVETCDDPLKFLNDENIDSLKAVRAMVVLGFIGSIGALVCVALLLFVMKEQKILGFIGGGVAIAAGLFHMIAMAIYVDKFKSDNSDLSAGFAFDILAWLVLWVGGAVVIFSAMKGGE